MPRAIPAVCLPFIREFEKGPTGDFAATTYIDRGAPCIGWGHRIVNRADPLLYKTLTRKDSDDLAVKDLELHGADVEKSLGSRCAKLNDDQFAALVLLVFNIGGKEFGGSTIRAKIIDGKLDEVPSEFGRWIFITTPHGKKISERQRKRREAEKLIWLGRGFPAKA